MKPDTDTDIEAISPELLEVEEIRRRWIALGCPEHLVKPVGQLLDEIDLLRAQLKMVKRSQRAVESGKIGKRGDTMAF